MVDPPTDTERIAQAREGDEAAWEMLVRSHQEPVFRLAYLHLGDPHDAEDVAQEAFIRAYKHLGRFDGSRPLRPWLMRIASNLARNRQRALSRYWHALERAARAQPNEPTTPNREDVEELWQALRRLKHSDQQVIYLRYYLEVPESEMADILEVPRGTVKSRLHRALGRLRQIVESEYPDLQTGPYA